MSKKSKNSTQDSDEEQYVLEEYELEESEDEEEYQYEEIASEDEDNFDEEEESLQAAITKLDKSQKQARKTPTGSSDEAYDSKDDGQVDMDDFVRNFLTKMGMEQTLEKFQQEWYELSEEGKIKPDQAGNLPDMYARGSKMSEEIERLRVELQETRAIATKAQAMWEKLRKERDFHRMHHKRVAQEKNRIIVDLKRVKKHYSSYEPALAQLKEKYEVAMKSKMLAKLERDKLLAEVERLENQTQSGGGEGGGVGVGKGKEKKTGQKRGTAKPTGLSERVTASAAAKGKAQGKDKGKEKAGARSRDGAKGKVESTQPRGIVRKGDSPWPKEGHKYAKTDFATAPVHHFKPTALYKAHSMSVSCVAVDPAKPVVATASDDGMWKTWSLKTGELVLSSDGHSDWIGGIDFHPHGSHLATASGDGTVKIWDFATCGCSHTFREHKGAVWDLKFHHSGDFFATASMDHSVKLWDLKSMRCRQTMRGHMDSVNALCFLPGGFLIASAAGDKTVSVWDPRTGVCVQTFFGHLNAVTGVSFSYKGDTVASTDADGMVKLWDTRMVAERAGITTGAQPANDCTFDRSGNILAVASDDGTCKLFNIQESKHLDDLQAHEGACECVVFDPNDQFLVTGGEDCNFRVFS